MSIKELNLMRHIAGGANRFAFLAGNIATHPEYRQYEHLVEIAVITLTFEGEVSEWHTLICPERDIHAESKHGLTSSDIAHAPSFQDIAGDLAEQISGACVVGFGIANTLRIMANDMYTTGIRSDIAENHLDIYNIFSKKGLEKANLPSEPDRSSPALEQARTTMSIFIVWSEYLEKTGLPVTCTGNIPHSIGRVLHRGDNNWVQIDDKISSDLKSYMKLLDNIFEDGIIDPDEAEQLEKFETEKFGKNYSAKISAKRAYIHKEIDIALDDKILDETEDIHLHNIAKGLHQGNDIIERRLRQHKMREIKIEPLLRGALVVRTGVSQGMNEGDIEQILSEHGFNVHGNISKEVQLIVAADLESNSSKAKKARKYGIPFYPQENLNDLYPNKPLRVIFFPDDVRKTNKGIRWDSSSLRAHALNLSEFLQYSEIPGLGAAKADRIAAHFDDTPDMLIDASVEDFLDVKGVGVKLADALFEALHSDPLQSDIRNFTDNLHGQTSSKSDLLAENSASTQHEYTWSQIYSWSESMPEIVTASYPGPYGIWKRNKKESVIRKWGVLCPKILITSAEKDDRLFLAEDWDVAEVNSEFHLSELKEEILRSESNLTKKEFEESLFNLVNKVRWNDKIAVVPVKASRKNAVNILVILREHEDIKNPSRIGGPAIFFPIYREI